MEELKFKNLHKFKVGDWIVFNGLTLYIKEIVKGYYRTISKGGITNSYDWDIDNLARLWSIEEAEIGDILTASDGSIFIYAGLKGTLAQSYIALLSDGDLNTMKCNWEEKTSVAPTTEEQRSLLFRKMKEAGYVWDEDKKELRKIKKINEKDMDYKKAYEDSLERAKELWGIYKGERHIIEFILPEVCYLKDKESRLKDMVNSRPKSINGNIPCKESEVICVNCSYRWIAERPVTKSLKDIECPWCGRQGFVIETGETIKQPKR